MGTSLPSKDNVMGVARITLRGGELNTKSTTGLRANFQSSPSSAGQPYEGVLHNLPFTCHDPSPKMITPKSTMAFQTNQKTLVTPRPSSPRQFFARIYGHLESEKPKSKDQEEQDRKSDDKKEKEYQRECQSVSNTDSSSDFEGPKCQRLGNDVREKAPASAALTHLAAASLPAVQMQPAVQRIPGFPGMPPGFAAGLATLPGFLAPRPPLLFAGEIPFHSGFSAFCE